MVVVAVVVEDSMAEEGVDMVLIPVVLAAKEEEEEVEDMVAVFVPCALPGPWKLVITLTKNGMTSYMEPTATHLQFEESCQ